MPQKIKTENSVREHTKVTKLTKAGLGMEDPATSGQYSVGKPDFDSVNRMNRIFMLHFVSFV